MSRLSPDHAADLLTYARAYAAHGTGALLPSRRPESLRHTVIGRIPALEPAA
jgi:predicted metal-binding protein